MLIVLSRLCLEYSAQGMMAKLYFCHYLCVCSEVKAATRLWCKLVVCRVCPMCATAKKLAPCPSDRSDALCFALPVNLPTLEQSSCMEISSIMQTMWGPVSDKDCGSDSEAPAPEMPTIRQVTVIHKSTKNEGAIACLWPNCSNRGVSCNEWNLSVLICDWAGEWVSQLF